ncbi:zinc knuckle domain protein [Aspergillus nomiae NRRL 13137]|uniref:Zinc knuckle domain protein n=1 Tax=Aspergillus nomiae NRRL (strain ATCC 15546 / NRRL 13137 / CBS 260.88 / M93) TaxID=1509407 RepID=A0A0L1J0W4_ASPN3|nr:zinc knuckle domain protein [Aspergillus nomiae NRRL 13137]KNG85399.1 zinc knuckle domain protein [Aspergillus nomiae NRRL 13137]
MPDSPGEDNNDSRTASFGVQRNRATSTNGSRQSSIDSNSHPRKRQRRNGKAGPTDARDFVPQGATFSANTLAVDPDSTSSSGSSGSDDESNFSDDGNEASSQVEPQSAAAPNWNKASRSTIRTSLNKRGNKENEVEQDSRFDAVNDKYWRSRSESVSTGGDNDDVSQINSDDVSEEGEVQEDDTSDSSRMHLSGDSDDSSLDSEADDSILLNINSRGQTQHASQKQNGGLSLPDDEYDPESLPVPQSIANGHTFDGARDAASSTSKEEAFRHFAQKYPTNPETLADLNREDMESQAKYIFYDREINDINLQLPVTCTECMREGHLAEVCPYKECVHCGAWDQHQSSFCPSWRRCQKCRERGHDQQDCSSLLKGSASEIPCDLCGSSAHLELECDFMWKAHRQEPSSGPVHVSISCSHCTSNHHLVGDCPSLPQPLKSSSWTLRGIDPNMVTNINSVVKGRSGGPSSRGRGGMKIRGRADAHSSPDDSDDLITRRRPVGRGGNRGNIRIGSGIGKNKNLAPAGSRGPDMDSRQFYRDRQDFHPGNARQRSLSPNPRRGRGKDSWQPAPRSPPRGQSRPPPRGGRGGGRGRGGRGNGNKRGGSSDAYRPMPSAAKKAWDKYRL